jgi:hypothetical protein
MKPQLTHDEVDGKMTWTEVVRYYKPDATDDEVEYLLWNETCYPFSDESTLKQINRFFNSKDKPNAKDL